MIGELFFNDPTKRKCSNCIFYDQATGLCHWDNPKSITRGGNTTYEFPKPPSPDTDWCQNGRSKT